MIVDFDINFLRSAANLVDSSLQQLEIEAASSPDPDMFGVFDKMEYLTGFGFVACQTYLTAVLSQSSLKGKKRKALELGPIHRSGQTMTELVNAAANHWKHNHEWSLDTSTSQAKQTLDVLKKLGVDPSASYPVGNMLYEILAPHSSRFANLIPFLTQWRDTLPR